MHHITAAALGSQFSPTQKERSKQDVCAIDPAGDGIFLGWMGGGIHNVEGRLGEVESCTTLERISSKGFWLRCCATALILGGWRGPWGSMAWKDEASANWSWATEQTGQAAWALPTTLVQWAARHVSRASLKFGKGSTSVFQNSPSGLNPMLRPIVSSWMSWSGEGSRSKWQELRGITCFAQQRS